MGASKKKLVVIFSCEHGGNLLPVPFKSLFKGSEDLFKTHRSMDFGALSLAREFAKKSHSLLVYSEITRLLIDLNRSPENKTLFSKISQQFSPEMKRDIQNRYYEPFRWALRAEVENQIHQGNSILHLSIHSFTPVFKGKIRKVDIGILDNPLRQNERKFSQILQKILKKKGKTLAIFLNRPYTGSSDSFNRSFRDSYSDEDYSGLELEVNQKFFFGGGISFQKIKSLIIEGVLEALPLYGKWRGIPLINGNPRIINPFLNVTF